MDLSGGRISGFMNIFSFSLNPEIVSVLWRTNHGLSADPGPRYRVAHPTNLFQILLFQEPDEAATFFTTLHNTVVTSGVLLIVGLSSFCTFKLLQCVRHEEFRPPTLQNIKSFVVDMAKPFVLQWRRCSAPQEPSDNVTCRIKNNNENGKQLCKRPSDLRILGGGSPRGNRFRSSRENSLERRLLTKDPTPLADCDIASGEEDIADIQGQYFGPTVRSSTFCVELLGSSPEESPIHSKSPRKGSAKTCPQKGKLSSQNESEL